MEDDLDLFWMGKWSLPAGQSKDTLLYYHTHSEILTTMRLFAMRKGPNTGSHFFEYLRMHLMSSCEGADKLKTTGFGQCRQNRPQKRPKMGRFFFYIISNA